MNGFSILMFIFGVLIFIVGLYMYGGHEFKMVSWKAAYKGLTKDGWKNIGRWTMIVSIIPFFLAIIGWIFDFK